MGEGWFGNARMFLGGFGGLVLKDEGPWGLEGFSFSALILGRGGSGSWSFGFGVALHRLRTVGRWLSWLLYMVLAMHLLVSTRSMVFMLMAVRVLSPQTGRGPCAGDAGRHCGLASLGSQAKFGGAG